MQRLSTFRMPLGFRGKSSAVVQIWWLVQSSLFSYSPQFAYSWRRFLLRLFGAEIGKGVIIRPSVTVTYPWKVKIGDYSWIGDDVVLYSLGDIEIGRNSVVSQKGYICTGSHDYTKADFPIFAEKITIGNGCWLATDVYVAPGVSIGDDAVVGARSSVFKSIEGGYVFTGSPVKAIKKREMVEE